MGAPVPFPFFFRAGGVIVAPPGALSETAVPALGFTQSSFGESAGTTLTTALLPTLSPSAISAGEPLVNQFPVFAFAEISRIQRISEGLDLGVRLTVQVSTPELFGPRQQPSGDISETIRDFQEASQPGAGSEAPTPNIGVTVFGRFELSEMFRQPR